MHMGASPTTAAKSPQLWGKVIPFFHTSHDMKDTFEAHGSKEQDTQSNLIDKHTVTEADFSFVLWGVR